jgi:hypothetical protein
MSLYRFSFPQLKLIFFLRRRFKNRPPVSKHASKILKTFPDTQHSSFLEILTIYLTILSFIYSKKLGLFYVYYSSVNSLSFGVRVSLNQGMNFCFENHGSNYFADNKFKMT